MGTDLTSLHHIGGGGGEMAGGGVGISTTFPYTTRQRALYITPSIHASSKTVLCINILLHFLLCQLLCDGVVFNFYVSCDLGWNVSAQFINW